MSWAVVVADITKCHVHDNAADGGAKSSKYF